MIQLAIVWILGGVSAYRLWENTTWLAIVAILLVLSYGVHGDENREHEQKGMYSKATGTRLLWTFALVVIIFVYSLASK